MIPLSEPHIGRASSNLQTLIKRTKEGEKAGSSFKRFSNKTTTTKNPTTPPLGPTLRHNRRLQLRALIGRPGDVRGSDVTA